MLIKIKSNTTEEFHNALKKSVKTKLIKEGYEYQSDFPTSFGDLSIKTYDFNNGFNFNVLKGDISNFFQLEFLEDDNNFIRYFFVLKGDLIHSVSTSVRYRLNDGYSCIVAAKGESNQIFSFPIQKNVNILFLQVATKRFGIESKKDLVNLPKEIGDVFMNKVMDNHFIYHSNYTLSILNTIMEIFNTKKNGIVKRFYLESKALELLWMQTEIYKEEVNLGFNKKVLRKKI
ncbi:hypothetical protein [Marivirga sp.]|uniref:hypothetical protein n=1 Tax=Marivirga sp. TaxID=2018662 RepID=UPI003DA75902